MLITDIITLIASSINIVIGIIVIIDLIKLLINMNRRE